EVERILAKPKPQTDKIYTVYPTSEGYVAVVYSAAPCSLAIGTNGEYKVDKDTVIDLRVGLEKPFPLTDLIWKKENYQRAPDPHRLDVAVYDDLINGIWITTEIQNGTEMVGGFWFRGSKEEHRRLACNSSK